MVSAFMVQNQSYDHWLESTVTMRDDSKKRSQYRFIFLLITNAIRLHCIKIVPLIGPWIIYTGISRYVWHEQHAFSHRQCCKAFLNSVYRRLSYNYIVLRRRKTRISQSIMLCDYESYVRVHECNCIFENNL